MQAFLKTFLALFGEKGLKALINTIASSAMFKDFVKGLIMARLGGLKDKYPSMYDTLDGYAEAVSTLPQIFSNDNPNDVEEVAELLRLKAELEKSLSLVVTQAAKFEEKSRALNIKI